MDSSKITDKQKRADLKSACVKFTTQSLGEHYELWKSGTMPITFGSYNPRNVKLAKFDEYKVDIEKANDTMNELGYCVIKSGLKDSIIETCKKQLYYFILENSPTDKLDWNDHMSFDASNILQRDNGEINYLVNYHRIIWYLRHEIRPLWAKIFGGEDTDYISSLDGITYMPSQTNKLQQNSGLITHENKHNIINDKKHYRCPPYL